MPAALCPLSSRARMLFADFAHFPQLSPSLAAAANPWKPKARAAGQPGSRARALQAFHKPLLSLSQTDPQRQQL